MKKANLMLLFVLLTAAGRAQTLQSVMTSGDTTIRTYVHIDSLDNNFIFIDTAHYSTLDTAERPVFTLSYHNDQNLNLPYSTQADHVWFQGINVGSSGTLDPNHGGIGIGMESYYYGGLTSFTKPQQEFYLYQGFKSGATPNNNRFLFYVGAEDGSTSNVGLNASHLVGLSGQQIVFSPYNDESSSDYYALFNNDKAEFLEPNVYVDHYLEVEGNESVEGNFTSTGNMVNIGSASFGATHVASLVSNDVVNVGGSLTVNSLSTFYGSTTFGGGTMFMKGGGQNIIDFTQSGIADRGGIGFASGSNSMDFYTGSIFGSGVKNLSLTPDGNAQVNNNIIARHLVGSSAGTTITGSGASVSGTDMAGTITITLGSAVAAGTTLCTVTFANAYTAAPHHSSPAANTGASAAVISDVYFTTSTTGLTLNVGSATLPAGTYSFDYILVQ